MCFCACGLGEDLYAFLRRKGIASALQVQVQIVDLQEDLSWLYKVLRHRLSITTLIYLSINIHALLDSNQRPQILEIRALTN